MTAKYMLFILLFFAVASTADPKADELQRAIFAVGVSSDTDGTIGPGGFEKIFDLDVRLISEVRNCRSLVMSAVRAWAVKGKLEIELDKESNGYGQLIVWATNKRDGFYELVYLADLERKQATATFHLRGRDLVAKPVPNSAGFAALKMAVSEALECRK